MEEKMIIYKTAINEQDWDKLVDHYSETGMCLGLGKTREIEKIRRAFNNSYRFVTAWDSDKKIGRAHV